jgi:hypothetical protein
MTTMILNETNNGDGVTFTSRRQNAPPHNLKITVNEMKFGDWTILGDFPHMPLKIVHNFLSHLLSLSFLKPKKL